MPRKKAESERVAGRIETLLALARAERERDPPRAAAAAAEAIRIARSGGYESGAAWGYAELAYSKSLRGKPLEALADGQEALGSFRRLGDARGEARALYALGTGCYHLSRWREARRYYEAGLALSLSQRDGEQALAARVALHSVLNSMGEFTAALAGCRRVLPIVSKGGSGHDQYHMATLTDIGYACVELGRLPEARRAHQAALALATRLKNPTRQAMALINLGEVALRERRFASAVGHCARAEALGAAVANPVIVASAQYGRGAAQTGQGRFTEAADALRACLATGRAHRRPDSVGLAWLGFSALFLRAGDPAKAARAARKAAALAAQSGNRGLENEAGKALADAERALPVSAKRSPGR
jgi:tetratricopeptide (TPR) repeat protein